MSDLSEPREKEKTDLQPIVMPCKFITADRELSSVSTTPEQQINPHNLPMTFVQNAFLPLKDVTNMLPSSPKSDDKYDLIYLVSSHHQQVLYTSAINKDSRGCIPKSRILRSIFVIREAKLMVGGSIWTRF